MRTRAKSRRARFILAALLSAAAGVQGIFIASYPQPPLFGDPVGYLEVGRNLGKAMSALREGKGIRETFVKFRGSLYFTATGIFYGAIDAVWPDNVQAIRWALLLVNILGFVGLYVLTRSLTDGSETAALGAVFLAILHPSFSTHLGRAYPDPLTACFFVWSAALFVRGVQEDREGLLRGSVFLLSCGLLVRPQILGPVVLVIAVICLAVSIGVPQRRRAVAVAVSGLLPAAVLWGSLQVAMAATANEKGQSDDFAGRYGWVVFNRPYPQGFWQYLETDGWEGPYRLRQEPFYKAFQEAAAVDPSLATSSARGYAFALKYALKDPVPNFLMMLDNSYRIFDHPVNAYRWDYPIPLQAQLFLHRLILVCALLQFAFLASRRPILLPIFIIPVSLATIHAFTFPWPRYSQSALLILIAAASAFLAQWRSLAIFRRSLLIACAVVIALIVLPSPSSTTGHFVFLCGWLGLLSVPFVFIARSGNTRWARAAPLLLCPILLAPTVAHGLRDRTWHERSLMLGKDALAVRQDIRLSREAATQLAEAKESFVVLDLRVPSGNPRGLRVELNGTPVPSDNLIATMPRLPESTTLGGRDPAAYRQWWAFPLPRLSTEGVPPEWTTLSVTVRSVAEDVELFGDRFAEEETVYEGPSFGDHPNAVALKLEYDGDYRTPKRYDLSSARTTSTMIESAQSPERPARMTFRIRVVTIADNTGELTFEGEAPAKAKAAWAFFGLHGQRGRAELFAGERGPVSFPLGASRSFEAQDGDLRFCYRPRPDVGGVPFGAFVISTSSATVNRPPEFRVSFKTGMSVDPMLFVIDRKASAGELTQVFEECGVPTDFDRRRVARLIDGSRNSYPGDTGRWRVAKVY